MLPRFLMVLSSPRKETCCVPVRLVFGWPGSSDEGFLEMRNRSWDVEDRKEIQVQEYEHCFQDNIEQWL